MTADMVDKVRVAVRVRPLNKRERELASTVVVEMQGKQTILYSPTISTNRNAAAEDSNHNPKLPPGKSFAFDHCFMSMDPSDRNFSSQENVFESVGKDLLESAFSGYNGCIFAYGQTGSGKSFTMMGTRHDQGIIPRLCNTLFNNIATTVEERMDISFKVEVSYMEIYNEKVHDLLGGGGGGKKNLRVREHKLLGPYVDGLSQLVVTSYDDIDNLMSEGNKSRTVAATNMNSESSRSHAVFNIIVTQTLTDLQTQVSGEKVSKLSLVDLAGSERAQKTGAVGERLREGSNINRSLTTLGLVISALADQGKFVPYRDSVLTWLLKDNLGGNSRTVMIATISPAGDNYEETLSTLRYADRAKRIVNHAVINEDPNAKIIRELREEVDRLRKDLESAMEKQAPELADKLEESEKLMKELTKTWEEKLEETERIHKARHDALEKMGISVEKAGIKVEHRKFFLVNLNADPSLNEMLVYYLKDVTHVGCAESSDVQLNGLGIAAEHCVLEIVPPGDPVDADVTQAVFLQPLGSARTLINGQKVTERTRLKHGDRILWGTHAFYRLSCPRPASLRKSNQSMNDEQAMMTSTCTTEGELMPPGPNSLLVTSTSSTGLEHMMGFDDAQAEVMQAELSWPCEPMTTDGVEYGDSVSADSQNQLQAALAKQKAMYEEQLELLKSQLILSPMQSGPQSTPLTPFSPWGSSTSGLSAGISAQNLHIQNKYREWAHEREQLLMQSLARLREQVARANTLVREANFMAEALHKKVEYSVTLQVPVENLTPNKKRAGLVSEPAVQVSRPNRTPQVWSMSKFENRIIDMREYYEEHLSLAEAAHDVMYRMPSGQLVSLDEDDEAFFDSQENHSLIGVANLFLAALFNNVELSYYVPIINQQGEISGKLQMKLVKLEGHMPTPGVDRDSEALPGAPGPMTASSMGGPAPSGYQLGSTARVQVSIIQAIGLPASLSHFVFCQYQMWGQPEPTMAGPAFQPDNVKRTGKAGQWRTYTAGNKVTVRYDHQAEFTIPITDDFLEHCAESALSVEVWGNPACGYRERRRRPDDGDEPEEEEEEEEMDVTAGDENAQELARFSERWQELCRRLELWVCIEELNDNGVYEKVEVTPAFGNSNSGSTHSSPGSVPNSPTTKANLLGDDVGTGGIYQLKHGQSRRVTVAVRPKKGGGDLPLICESIQQICMGCVLQRFKSCQRGLDSYQESDLAMLRDCWSEAVRRRQDYLHERLQLLVDRAKKTRAEEEREKSLMGQWMRLTAERDAVLLPEPGTGIPGSPASWKPVEGMERHCPVIFLNLRPEDMTSLTDKLLMAGHNCLLPKEHSMQATYIQLPLVKHYRASVIGAVGQWDASLHDSLFMNRVTPTDERIYMIVKVVVRLTHPATMDLVLRKRICVNIYRKQSLRGYLSRQWNKYMANEVSDENDLDMIFDAEAVNRPRAQLRWTGVTFQVVSSIPQASQEMEDRESLARLAATEDTENSSTTAPGSDGQTYIEKYIRSVSAVEGILQLDRLRQEVAVKEALAADKRRKQRNAANWEKYQRVEDYNNPATMRKYISVPNLQAMNRSSSMHSLVTMQTSAITPSSTRTESVFNLSDQPAQRRASDVVGIPERAVRKRPEPPKGLVVAAKNPLISPLSTGPKYGSFVGGLATGNRPSMGPLEEEERHRKPHPLILTEEKHWIGNKNATEPEDIEADSKFEPGNEGEAVMEISEQAPTSTLDNDPQLFDRSTRIDATHDEVFQPTESETKAADADVSHQVRGETLRIQTEVLTASVTQESLSETTAASSGYDSQAVSTTTLESEENLANVAVTETNDMDTPKGDNLADEALNNVNGDEPHFSSDEQTSQHEDLKKDVSLNEDELRALVGSRAELEAVSEPLAAWIQVGERVKVDTNKGRQPGWIRFVGATQFAPGTWIGVELEQAEGKNDGSVQTVRYFKCRKRHGVFVRQDKIAAAKRRSSGAKTARTGPSQGAATGRK